MNSIFLDTPFIPSKNVSLMLVDGRVPEGIIKLLKSKNIEVIKTEKSEDVHDSISFHPDIMFHPVGNNRIVAAPNISDGMMNMLKTRDFEINKGKTFLNCNYPHDIAYNVARIGNIALHNFRYTDPVLKNILIEQGIKLIHVNQGYTKCSICIINESAVICSDEGVGNVLIKEGIDVLLLSKGFIELKGFDYGFIGGCTGLIGKSNIFFSGDPQLHNQWNQIKLFLEKYRMNYICYSGKILYDYGSFIPLK